MNRRRIALVVPGLVVALATPAIALARSDDTSAPTTPCPYHDAHHSGAGASHAAVHPGMSEMMGSGSTSGMSRHHGRGQGVPMMDGDMSSTMNGWDG